MSVGRRDRIAALMQAELGSVSTRVALQTTSILLGRTGMTLDDAPPAQALEALTNGLQIFLRDKQQQARVLRRLAELLGVGGDDTPDTVAADSTSPTRAPYRTKGSGDTRVGEPTTVTIYDESAVSQARDACRTMSASLGFGPMECTKLSTVASELVRNVVQYAHSGMLYITALDRPRRGLELRAVDRGPGINNLDVVLSGRYQSKTGMGRGLVGSKAIMDDFDVQTSRTGTVVRAVRYVPAYRSAPGRRFGR